jgi:hypothetical protein
MPRIHRSAARRAHLLGPFAAFTSEVRHALVLLRFATSSTTAADWRKWTEVHTPRKSLPG